MTADERPYLPQRNEWRLDELDKRLVHLDDWRRRQEQTIANVEARIVQRIEEIDRLVQSMSSASQVADEVARRLDGRRKLELTVAQRFLAGVVVLLEPIVSAVISRHL